MPRNQSSLIALALGLAVFVPTEGRAQATDPGAEQMIDRVVAVVGDSAILASEVEQGLQLMELRGWRRPTAEAELHTVRLDILNQLITEQMIIQDAARDTTLVIDQQELDQMVDQEIEAQRQRIGTQRMFEQALAEDGFTVASYREDRREFFRRQRLNQAYVAKNLGTATAAVTDEEIEAYYRENQARMPQRPATVKFLNYRLKPVASDTALAGAEARAREVLVEARRSDADFEALAREYSQGPTRDVGGALGWIREDGSYAPEFEEAVFMLPPGIVSEPVKTEFGYHLILVERIRAGERRVRHILFVPTVTEDDIDRSLQRAEDLKTALETGGDMTPFAEVPADTLEVPQDRLGELSNFYARAMSNASPGDVLGPLQLNDPSDENTVGVAVMLEVRPGGTVTVDDVRNQIEQVLQEQKLMEQLQADLRSRTYVENRLESGN